MNAISLYCDKDHARQEIGRLVRHRSTPSSWNLDHPSVGYSRELTKMTQILGPDGSLIYSDPIKARETGHTYLGDVSHDVTLTRRYRITCPACLTRVVTLDDPPLRTVLDLLAENGIAEMRLAELHSALRRKRATQC